MSESRFALIALLCWIGVTSFVALHHEPWRDEADSWLIVRDNDLQAMTRLARYGGFPALWYLAVAPLPRLGAPYAAQTALNLAFAAGAVALLLFRAPLPRSTKLLAAFSYYLAYEYAVIARPYALSILLLFAAAALWNRNLACPIILALAMSVNAHATVIAFALAVAWFIARPEARRHAWIVLLGAAAGFLQFRKSPDAQQFASLGTANLPALPFTLGHAFLPAIPMIVGAPLALVVLGFVAWSLRHSRSALAMLGISLGGLLAISVFVYIGGFRHAGFVLIATLLAMWIGRVPKRAAWIALNLALAASTLVAISYWRDDLVAAFSGSKEMAAKLSRFEGYEIAAHGPVQCEAILPYLPGRRFWYPGFRSWGTHMLWNQAQDEAVNVSYPDAVTRARTRFGSTRWLLLLNVEMPDPASRGFRLVDRTRKPVFEKTDERYWLYAPLPMR